jgi:histidinol phosphatase-like PHP family hydrolase
MDLSEISFMDLHNHTIWSDGIHTPEKIIQNAIVNSVTTIGISDHFETDKCQSVLRKDIKNYIININELKEKYKDKIQVLAGIEICMNKELCDLDNLPYEELNKLDYVLLEYIDYFKHSVKLCEIGKYTSKLTCKIGLAHTNLLTACKIYGLRYVVNTLKEHNLFWELNVNEGYDYFDEVVNSIDSWKTSRLLKKLKKNNILMSVGSDTHSLDYYDIEKLTIGNMIAKHQSIRMLKYDFSVNRLMHGKTLTHYGA